VQGAIRNRQYIMTLHVEEEMNDDDLTIFDIERVVLTGTIIERQKDQIRNENEITYRFESRFILSDYVAKRQEYSSMPTFSRLVRQAARLSKTGNLFNSRSLAEKGNILLKVNVSQMSRLLLLPK
jgi:hypothetical protein